jgi:hypothetical protein
MTPSNSDTRPDSVMGGDVAIPDGCPTCGALPCDWTDRPSPASYAAPELLAALEGLLRAVDALMPTDGPLKIAARIAIAKARGETA